MEAKQTLTWWLVTFTVDVQRATFRFGAKLVLLKKSCFNITMCVFPLQHVFTMDPTNVENGRGKVPHDPSLSFASTFSGTSHVVPCLYNWDMHMFYWNSLDIRSKEVEPCVGLLMCACVHLHKVKLALTNVRFISLLLLCVLYLPCSTI